MINTVGVNPLLYILVGGDPVTTIESTATKTTNCCSDPILEGCYEITFDGLTACPGDPGHYDITWTDCDGNVQILNPSLGQTVTVCALVGGGVSVEPTVTCGTADILISDPCVLILYQRTMTGETSPYAGDGCLLDLLESCKLQMQNPNPLIVTSGDRVWNSPGSGFFNGEGKTYRIEISTSASGDPSYVVTIDNFGYVNILSVCT
jgi:hypothetical protein